MTDKEAKLNTEVTWVCSGADDSITCSDMQQRTGVQVDTGGFNLEDVVVTITMPNGTVKDDPLVEDGTGPSGLIGEGFKMKSISISGVTAGTYVVTFSQ